MAGILPNLQKGTVISVYEAQKSITRVNTKKYYKQFSKGN